MKKIVNYNITLLLLSIILTIESTVEEEDDAAREKDPAMLQVPVVGAAQTDAVAECFGEEAAGQGEHPEEERED